MNQSKQQGFWWLWIFIAFIIAPRFFLGIFLITIFLYLLQKKKKGMLSWPWIQQDFQKLLSSIKNLFTHSYSRSMDTTIQGKKLRWGRWVTLGVILILFFSFMGSFFVIIDAGQVGVRSTFGKVDPEIFQSGFHLKNPFTKVIRMGTRTNSYTMSATYAEGEVHGDDSIQALAKDGGSVWFDVTVLYRLLPEAAPETYRTLGTEYAQNIIRPEIRSVIREVAANYPVNELYSTKREEVQQSILNTLKAKLEVRKIVMEDVLLRNVSVSQTLLDSIGQKLAAEQEVQRQQFEIEKAKKEAERRVIEAQGQRDAQKIIDQGLSENYLNYLYLQNLKDREGTIYVPIDPNNGLPLFRGL